MLEQYPETEVLIRGLYCRCQVLTKPMEDGNYPKYLAVNSLHKDRPGEFIATRKMGAWCVVSLQDVVNNFDEYRRFLVEHSKDYPDLQKALQKFDE